MQAAPLAPELTVIVVSFNTRELTLRCLASLATEAGDVAFETILVDNASADGSAEAVRTAFPDVRLIALEENVGFARANNRAAREARGELLLLLNPDTEVRERAVERLVAFLRARPQAGVCGGRTLHADGTLNPSSCWGRPTPWSLFCMGTGLSALFRRSSLFDPESLGPWRRDDVREVDVVSGCLFLIRRGLWEALEGFDERFFVYGEDADLCLRAKARGAPCLICPEAEIVHVGGASEPVRADKLVRLFRAKAQLFAKHWSPRAARFGVAMLDLWALTRTVGLALVKTVRPAKAPAFRAWRDTWRRRSEWRAAGAAGGSRAA